MVRLFPECHLRRQQGDTCHNDASAYFYVTGGLLNLTNLLPEAMPPATLVYTPVPTSFIRLYIFLIICLSILNAFAIQFQKFFDRQRRLFVFP